MVTYGKSPIPRGEFTLQTQGVTVLGVSSGRKGQGEGTDGTTDEHSSEHSCPRWTVSLLLSKTKLKRPYLEGGVSRHEGSRPDT